MDTLNASHISLFSFLQVVEPSLSSPSASVIRKKTSLVFETGITSLYNGEVIYYISTRIIFTRMYFFLLMFCIHQYREAAIVQAFRVSSVACISFLTHRALTL